jgi:hypothetical protein
MINLLINFFKHQLHDILKTDTNETVTFPKFDTDPPVFTANTLSLFVVNLEEDVIMREPDRYIQYNENGKPRKSFPALRLNLYILLAAKYGDYEAAMKNLSKVLHFFQRNPVFTRSSHPSLPEELSKLTIELTPLSYSQLNEIWSSMKTAAIPALCYKVKMIVIDEPAIQQDTEIGEMTYSLKAS